MWPLATPGTAQLIGGTFPRWSAACRMSAPKTTPTKMSGSDTRCRRATKMSHPPRQKCRLPPDKNVTQNNTRIIIQERIIRGRARESVRDVLRESFPWNERLTEALLAFEESRAAGKHPLTVNAASLACNKLNQLADEAGVRDRYGYMAAVLEQSILRGWEGLFALKGDFVDAVPTQRPASTEDRPREIGPDTDILDFL